MKTLNEVSKIVGMSRRVIQEYEKVGLATTPTKTNKYGHLLYDDKDLERLWQIRFYRELEYDKKQIKAIFEDPNFNKQQALESQIELLEKKKEHLESLIETAKAMNEMGIYPATVRFGLQGFDVASYDNLFMMLGAGVNIIKTQNDVEESFVEVLTEEDNDIWFDAVERIMGFCDKGLDYETLEVQEQISIMHSITVKEISDSIILFALNNLAYAPGSEIAKELDKIYGNGKAAYLYGALQHYCSVNNDNATDRDLSESLENIRDLALKKHSTNSDEIQAEVKRIHHFFTGIKVVSDSAQLQLLTYISDLFSSKAYKKAIDNGAERGVSWFISRAIHIYCEKLKKDS